MSESLYLSIQSPYLFPFDESGWRIYLPLTFPVDKPLGILIPPGPLLSPPALPVLLADPVVSKATVDFLPGGGGGGPFEEVEVEGVFVFE